VERGAIHENADRVPSGEDCGDCGLGGRLVRNVGGERHRLAACCADVLGEQLGCAQVEASHLGSLGRKEGRDGTANTTCRPGDDGDLACQHVHQLWPRIVKQSRWVMADPHAWVVRRWLASLHVVSYFEKSCI
jgi:hypothetical protein